jgi:hypothetical protein
LVCAPGGIQVAVRVFPGNTADPTAFKDAITAVKDDFHMDTAVMVGDRGMVTGARIDDLRERGGLAWVGALDRPQIAALAADQVGLETRRQSLEVMGGQPFGAVRGLLALRRASDEGSAIAQLLLIAQRMASYACFASGP